MSPRFFFFFSLFSCLCLLNFGHESRWINECTDITFLNFVFLNSTYCCDWKKKCIKLLKLSFLILAKFFERLQQIEKFLRKNCILIGWKYYWNQLCWLIWEKKFLIALLQRFIIDAVSGSLDLYFIFLSKILFLRHFEYFCIWMVLVYIELQF